MAKDRGNTFDVNDFAKAFSEALDLRGFADAFRSAFDLKDGRKSFVAGFRGGADLIAKPIRRTGAVLHTNTPHRDVVHGQQFLQRLLADVAGGGGAAVKALRAIRDLMRPYNPWIDAIPDEHLPALVKRIIEDLEKPTARPDDFTGAVARALAEAQARAAELAFNEAAQVLDAALAQTETDDRERARSRAALLAERSRIARLQLRYREAAGFCEQAAEVVAFDARKAWEHRLQAADAYYSQGDEFGDNAALGEAIALYQSALDLVSRERFPLEWADIQHDLVNALRLLGRREITTALLEEAFEEAIRLIEERRRAAVKLPGRPA